MIKNELLSRHRIDKLSVVIVKDLEKEFNEAIKDIKESDHYAEVQVQVQQSAKFIEELAERTQELIKDFTDRKLKIAWGDRYEAKNNIRKEVDARLATIQIDSYENIISDINESIQVEDFIG